MANVMKSEFLVVAEQIMERERRPMGPVELVEYGMNHRLFTHQISGKTPHQTMKSKLSVHVRKLGERSVFVRTEKGKFFLRSLVDDFHAIYNAPPLLKPPSKEKVMVFPTGWLGDTRRFQGITTSVKSLPTQLFRSDVPMYKDRRLAELDDDHKQIITYVVLTNGPKVLAFKRGNYTRVVDFLRGSHCIGFGGHVSEEDRTLFDADMGVEASAVREVGEELKLPDIDKERLNAREGFQLIGLLNDDSSPDGRRHFAFVYQYEVSNDRYWEHPERGERSVTQLRWLNPKEPRPAMWEFEYWSQLCLREFFPRATRAAPTFRLRRKRPLLPPHVLCVIGPVGSGKSEATQVLEKEFGYKVINTGHLVAELLGVSPVPATPREEFQRLAGAFIQTTVGPDRLAAAIADRMAADEGGRVLVDGIRQQTTLDCLKARVGGRAMGMLYVHTPPDLAYQFYRDRECKDFTILDFLRVRGAAVESEVEGMIVQSDAVLYNWTGKDAYRRAVRKLMGNLLG